MKVSPFWCATPAGNFEPIVPDRWLILSDSEWLTTAKSEVT